MSIHKEIERKSLLSRARYLSLSHTENMRRPAKERSEWGCKDFRSSRPAGRLFVSLCHTLLSFHVAVTRSFYIGIHGVISMRLLFVLFRLLFFVLLYRTFHVLTRLTSEVSRLNSVC